MSAVAAATNDAKSIAKLPEGAATVEPKEEITAAKKLEQRIDELKASGATIHYVSDINPYTVIRSLLNATFLFPCMAVSDKWIADEFFDPNGDGCFKNKFTYSYATDRLVTGAWERDSLIKTDALLTYIRETGKAWNPMVHRADNKASWTDEESNQRDARIVKKAAEYALVHAKKDGVPPNTPCCLCLKATATHQSTPSNFTCKECFGLAQMMTTMGMRPFAGGPLFK